MPSYLILWSGSRVLTFVPVVFLEVPIGKFCDPPRLLQSGEDGLGHLILGFILELIADLLLEVDDDILFLSFCQEQVYVVR